MHVPVSVEPWPDESRQDFNELAPGPRRVHLACELIEKTLAAGAP